MPKNNALPGYQKTAALALPLLLCVAGCNPGPKYKTPAPPPLSATNYKESTVNFKDGNGWKVADPKDAMLRGKWWEIYQDPELNALEEQVQINNQNIQQALENYMEARTLIGEAHAQYWPTVAVGGSYTRSRASANTVNTTNNSAGSSGSGTGGSVTTAGRQSTVWSAPLQVSWEPDLWGKIRNQVKQAQYSAQVSAADLENERLSQQSSLAQYYFEIRGQDALQAILDETVAADKKSLDLTQGLFDAGMTNRISVVQARATLESAQATAASIGVARAQYQHAIAMLVGKSATDFEVPVRALLREPPPIPTGVPAQLLERRPDIAAAERTLASANATIGIGYGAFFPDVTLSTQGGFESSTLKHLFDWPSRFWSIGPSASETVFNGGLYKAELHQYTAAYNADVATYRQTVLTAMQQVEDSLAAVRIESQQIEHQQRAVQSARESFDLQMGRFETGIDPYIDVVTAQATLLADRQALATQQVQQMTASVELIAALGGGWDRSQLPSPNEVSQKPSKGTYAIKH